MQTTITLGGDMKNRRVFQRDDLLVTFEVRDLDTGEMVGYLKEATQDGFSVISDHSNQTNAHQHFMINLRNGVEGVDKIMVDAIGVHCEMDKASHHYNTGYRYEHLTGDVRKKLNILIHHLSSGEHLWEDEVSYAVERWPIGE